ncbi:Isoleucyl-tRNA synthetase [Rhizoctonia solani]|uniref:isoleucine--tRNA ligase n=1 Tax=Rhizoctonia solani TaxID=456999 RepID=A0A8H8T078_9AGAM|nr:Isoleucyl-tRNA synthetase [Rhizoctonia solani]QRW23382.1 Isoleucyl-tRNA synthetase [Rhizoctonia solani]
MALPSHLPLLATLRIACARCRLDLCRNLYSSARFNSTQASGKNSFANTLLLPKTSFPLWAEPSQREVPYRKKTTADLYEWQWKNRDQAQTFVLHDGPPYANGSLHCGHALNKILKDIINRFHVMQGHRVHYMPGWDCHGLPIENKALQELKGDARQSCCKDRSAAREVALREMEKQKTNFKNSALWPIGPPMDAIVPLVLSLATTDLCTGRLPRFQLCRSGTYICRRSPISAVHVAFPFNRVPRHFRRYFRQTVVPSLMIWTTTPWTVPSNMAVAVNAEIDYSIAICQDGRSFIVATSRARNWSTACLGRTRYSSLKHHAKHVTADSGTGLVHTAPAHGPEDYAAGEVPSTRAISCVRYPYDWKTKKPVIFRATSQWFTNLDKIKDKALEALKDVKFYPEASRSRLEAFVRERSEWCISRQRTWGVPIPALYDSVTDEALLTSES